MYYLTIAKDDVDMIRRKPFEDYGEAFSELLGLVRPRGGRSVLQFSTEVINGRFARSYLTLDQPELVCRKDAADENRYLRAVKHRTAYDYEGKIFVLIESEVGIADADEE